MSQLSIAKSLGVSPSIDPEDEISRRVGFLQDYLLKTGLNGYVLGISGGQDSALAGRLCQLAVQGLRTRVEGVSFWALRLPYRRQQDEEDARLALDFIRADHVLEIDIAPAVEVLDRQFLAVLDDSLSDFDRGNLKARMRMLIQYALAGRYGALVAGTDHAAEAVTGFFTKHGDGAADVLPLYGLSKRQGKALLQALKAPSRLWKKTPTADLLDSLPGRADEAELGLAYEDIDDFLEGKKIKPETAASITERFRLTEHKRRAAVRPVDDWWLRG